MRRITEDISLLQKQISDLQAENRILKELLERAHIPYEQEIRVQRAQERVEPYDANQDAEQGARILHPTRITDDMVNFFFSRFWGRQDVYAKRSESKNTGEAGYYTQCHHFWKEICPKKYREKISCKDCPHQNYKQLTKADVLNHLYGRSQNASDVIGVYPLFPDGTCRFLVFDFDNHEKGAEKKDFANREDSWTEEVDAMREICVLNGIDPLIERSRSGKGAHLWIFFDKAISAALARKFAAALLEKGAEQVNLKSFRYYDRMLPAQDAPVGNGLGNLIALPLQGKALRNGNSAFVDQNWNTYPNQWAVLKSKPRLSEAFLEAKLKEWSKNDLMESERNGDKTAEREKPWRNQQTFRRSDIEGSIHITLSNGIYVDQWNLKPAAQNRIRRMAALRNPLYYRNLAIGNMNFDTMQWIYLGKDHLSGYIQIPRGLYEELTETARNSGVPWEVIDEREKGRKINVTFQGTLRTEQRPALDEMCRHDNGILHATTAFGKTVVCSAMIAEKKVNTLILVESAALLEQWKQALEKFLAIQEDFPKYKTKTGRTKTRSSLIGTLQGAQDSLTGIVDIAMAGSLRKKGEWHPMLAQYGMVIVDECHHAASDTVASVLQEAKAKYVYGVTATPKRADGLEKMNSMLIGPIRYRYTAKEKAKAQGIEHLVYPRFTRTVPTAWTCGKMHPNEAYELVRNNPRRDAQIISDVKACIAAGRTPVVLSRYKDHTERLHAQFEGLADRVFLLTGSNSKKQHAQILQQMQSAGPEESIILAATGSLIGEGFDYPRLDTLIMATPVSFQSVVEQYAGRLNRDYEGKKNVVIYDYVDAHIPMFDRMYARRLKAYRQIGYDVCSGISSEKPTQNAIFDSESYQNAYRKDLLSANARIIISSPDLSAQKVSALINLLKPKQEAGVAVTIVTWEPDLIRYGDAAFWAMLQEQMRQAGFYMKLQTEHCEHFAILDDELVWYGSMSLLGKEKLEDSMMRVQDRQAAAELLELTFRQR